ncbi:MAG TPA: ferritin-like domain-containing protein, partial [Acetobacteraceae bacterium]|nr:ferritin-like domain-containing protein [Acetobacteraceae bacterium]
MQNAAVAAADHTARTWTFPTGGALPPGEDAHKAMFCRMFLETFNPYKPAVIDWPTLDDETRARLVNLPIWDIAVQTEGRARLRM